jgi:methanethiol S-methyltransferase
MTAKTTPASALDDSRGSALGRFFAFLYGVASYAIFFVTFLYAVGFVTRLGVPKTIDDGPAPAMTEALLVNLLLMSAFAIQHSVMARQGFKQWSSLCLALLLWQWRPMPSVVWRIESPELAAAVTGLSLVGWLIVLTSTFLINHFELFGLHQVANNLAGKTMPAPRFRTPLFYKFVRHPIYMGFIIAFWAAPTMTVGHLLFAAVTTAYIFVGILLEERDLLDLFGDDYRSYRERVSMLGPWRRSA